MNLKTIKILIFICFFSFSFNGEAQVNWTNDGDSYFKLEENQLLTYTLPNHDVKTVISQAQLTPAGETEPIEVAHFTFSEDQQKILLFINTKKVWSYIQKGIIGFITLKQISLVKLEKAFLLPL